MVMVTVEITVGITFADMVTVAVAAVTVTNTDGLESVAVAADAIANAV